LRKGQERHLIAKELEPYIKELSENNLEVELRRVEKDLHLAEALRLRAEGKMISEVLRETGISKSKFYRSDDEDVYEKLSVPRRTSPDNNKELNIPTLHLRLSQALHNLRRYLLSVRVSMLDYNLRRNSRDFEEEYIVRKPIGRDFSREILCEEAKLYESTLLLSHLSLILCGEESFKCPKCQADLKVEKQTPYRAVTVQCKNCNALII